MSEHGTITRRALIAGAVTAAAGAALAQNKVMQILVAPAGYVAKAVHFDGSTFLRRSAGLNAVNGPRGFLSVWALANPPSGFYFGLLSTINFNIDLRPKVPGNYITMILAESSFTNWVDFRGPDNAYDDGEWYHILMSWDVSFDSGSRRLAIYVNDVLQSLTSIVDAGVAFDINYQNAPMNVGSYNDGSSISNGDLSDLNFNTTTSIVQADGTIALADRRRFISALGKPVDPAVPTASYGASALLLSGDSTTFSNNQGTGGAFTVTGALTDAPTHP